MGLRRGRPGLARLEVAFAFAEPPHRVGPRLLVGGRLVALGELRRQVGLAEVLQQRPRLLALLLVEATPCRPSGRRPARSSRDSRGPRPPRAAGRRPCTSAGWTPLPLHR
eukprot:14918313-Alexandrium_andersonii.AAC.1